MSEHHAGLVWKRQSADFTYDSYNRAHDLVFKGGDIVLPASSAPDFKGDATRVDPEEAFVAALSSCHMLTFLSLCARKRLTVDSYADAAVGTLEKNEQGRLAITRVVLHPQVAFAPGCTVDAQTLTKLHHGAHTHCFIANSVTTEVSVAAPEQQTGH